jgi:hypothetical protein
MTWRDVERRMTRPQIELRWHFMQREDARRQRVDEYTTTIGVARGMGNLRD